MAKSKRATKTVTPAKRRTAVTRRTSTAAARAGARARVIETPRAQTAQEFYKELRDTTLSDFEQDLNNLQGCNSGNGSDWEDIIGDRFEETKRQYIEYLIAYVAGSALGMSMSPPLNVDVLWHSHLLETASYRRLEKVIIDKFKEWRGENNTISLEHIDHSVVKNREGRAERLKYTANLFVMLGFDEIDSDESLRERRPVNDSRTRRREDEVTSTNRLFKIFVRTLTGNIIPLDVSIYMTTRSIKVMIQDMEDYPVDQQRIIFGGRQLKDDITLREYNVQSESTLHLVLSLAGC